MDDFELLFDAVRAPRAGDPDIPSYSVRQVAEHNRYFVGRDTQSRACILVRMNEEKRLARSPVQLESLDVQFGILCRAMIGGEEEERGHFTVIRCRSTERETIRYFLNVCRTIVQLLGREPSSAKVAEAVYRLAAMFRKTEQPPLRTVNGLFGELYIIARSSDPRRALMAWRLDDTARFDFVADTARLEVKTTMGRVRAHRVSYEQCNAAGGGITVLASLFVERVSGGLTLRKLIEEITHKVGDAGDLVLKLYEVSAETLGTSVAEAMKVAFDQRLAEASLRFFDFANVPAIRQPVPDGVSAITFRADLSAVKATPVSVLIREDAALSDLLPQPNG